MHTQNKWHFQVIIIAMIALMLVSCSSDDEGSQGGNGTYIGMRLIFPDSAYKAQSKFQGTAKGWKYLGSPS